MPRNAWPGTIVLAIVATSFSIWAYADPLPPDPKARPPVKAQLVADPKPGPGGDVTVPLPPGDGPPAPATPPGSMPAELKFGPRPPCPLPGDRLKAIVSQVQSAKIKYAPVTAESVQEAKQALSRALGELLGYLGRHGSDGAGWKTFLELHVIELQLQPRTTFDAEALQRVYVNFITGHKTLEYSRFVRVRNALRAYIDRSQRLQNALGREEYDQMLEALAVVVEAQAQTGAREMLPKIAGVAQLLENAGQAPELVAALRKEYSQSNLHVRVSDRLISAALYRPVDMTAPVTDNIMGTRINGCGRTVGVVQARLVPDSQRAAIETVMTGTNYSRTVGVNGPAIIHSAGQAQLFGTVRFMLDAHGLQSMPAQASASLNTQVTGVGSTRGGIVGRIVQRVAKKRIPQQKAASERIATQKAQQMLASRLNDEAGPMLTKANDDFREKFRVPLLRLGQFPRELRFGTTSNNLYIRAFHDGHGRFAAPDSQPRISADHELAVCVHESLVNNGAAGALAGRTITQREVEELSLKYLGKLPDRLSNDKDDRKEPWSITFAAPEPVTLTIDDNVAVLTIRGQEYTSGARSYDAMNITVRYRFEHSGQRLVATRLGELEILPPDFIVGEQMPTRQVVLRRLLKKRFEKIFEPKIVGQGLKLPNNPPTMGTLVPTTWHADNGWLAVGWHDERRLGTVVRHASSHSR